MNDALIHAYLAALDGMKTGGPRGLHVTAAFFADAADRDALADGTAFFDHLRASGPDDLLRHRLAIVLPTWDDAHADLPWTADTEARTPQRRSTVCRALEIDTATVALLADLVPLSEADGPVVIADDWDPWRTPERRYERDFYWAHYAAYLAEVKGWSPRSVQTLDRASELIVERLTDPMNALPYQAKGLVVGYVQSGKTANFTGTIAKAVDAGYRLIIVLTGTTNMLRAQTQRRLDMELVGRENLEREISSRAGADDADYHDDPEWIDDLFLRHGTDPNPGLHRLTTHQREYRRLGQAIAALDFERYERTRPFYHNVNLFTSNARLVVAKKNATALKHLVEDLGRISAKLSDIPALIVDDESDLASVNTTDPRKLAQGRKKRTEINKRVSELLGMMPRAQWVGYTATPFANVFVDPADAEDIFPSNFIISLPPPETYMGPEGFHDLDDDRPVAERDPSGSKERAHVRLISDPPLPDELREAMDVYVLTGAVKVYRERAGTPRYKHHTMLVHEDMKKATHRDTADQIRMLWDRAGYYTGAGLPRLRKLYETDVAPISRALCPDAKIPDFDEIAADLSEALDRINPRGPASHPVLVVNSEKDTLQEDLDFDKRDVWRILVGGNKLARGFTVEGLTVSYFRRATRQADTLMQMGRWFGFRPGYRDLVRLYTTLDLQAAFAAACRDEEYFRDELRLYAGVDADGRPLITPEQIPPLVAQHLPTLRPTSRNKMFNAKLVSRSSAGRPLEPMQYPIVRDTICSNTEAFRPLLAAAGRSLDFYFTNGSARFDARVGSVTHAELLSVLEKLEWLDSKDLNRFGPDLEWLKKLTPQQISKWILLFPQPEARRSRPRTILGHGPFAILERNRRVGGPFERVAEGRHMNAARRIVGIDTPVPDPVADSLHGPATGSMLVYPSVESSTTVSGDRGDPINPAKVTLGFLLLAPTSTAPVGQGPLIFSVRDRTRADALIVNGDYGD